MDTCIQILIGGANYAYVDRQLLAPADPLDDALLEET